MADLTNNKRKEGDVNCDDYKRNVIKKCRVKGQEYTNYKGNSVAAKSIGAPCNCKLKCFENITVEKQGEAFERLYGLATKDEQDFYLQGLVQAESVKTRRRRRSRTPRMEDSRRNTTFKYYILVGSERQTICKNAFLSLHSISNKRLQHIQQLLKAGVTPTDRSGKQVSTNAMPATEKIRIHEHIATFLVKSSHYSSREYHYLDSNLTVSLMYSMFMEKYPGSKIKYEFYNKIFKEEFDLKFGRPQVDTCCMCESLSLKIKSKDLNENAKRVATAEVLVHKRCSKKFYTALQESTKKSKESDNVVALAFDYMQNLQLPKIPVQVLFYLRQLTVSVFCIHNMKTDEVVYLIYHEGTAKKGSNKVYSFLYQYIKDYIPDNVRELHLFSNNCPGQNKNNTLIRMCMSLKDSGRFENIQPYFPIRGHSFLPCDRDFGILKRKLKKIDRVYTLHQYVEIIANASSKHRFFIHVVDGRSVINFKDWWPMIYKKTSVSVETSQRGILRDRKVAFNINSFHHFSYCKTNGKCVVVAKDYINGFVINTFRLGLSENEGQPQEICYPTGKIPIKSDKMDHIEKSAKYVEDSTETKEFWDEIFEGPIVE